eukprot:gene5168-5406_t
MFPVLINAVAPPGYFVSGEAVVACPKGEFQEEYGMITSCKSCVDEVGGKAVFSASGSAVTPSKVTGARPCPQGFFCLSGNPSVSTNISLVGGSYILVGKARGIPQACPRGLTTADEGSYSIEQCGEQLAVPHMPHELILLQLKRHCM